MPDEMLASIDARLAALETRAAHLERLGAETRRLVGPFAAPLGRSRLLVHTLHSILMIVDADDLIITPQLVVYRQWEPDLSALVSNSCKPDTVFVDVGANIGYFTLLAGSRIHAGGSGRVIAVEPNPDCCALLERNLVINWSMCPIDLHRVAVGAEPGEVWLEIPTDRAANGRIAVESDANEGGRRFRVPKLPLDAIVPAGLAVDILKIDVEGHELSVFEGAHRVFAESPRIQVIMEWSQKQMAEAGVTPRDMQGQLNRFGLVPRRLPESRNLDDLTPENAPPISFEELSRTPYDNILLTPRI